MNALPAEILLEIGAVDKTTYRSMLAIPKFAHAVTIGYRLDMMVKSGYEYLRILEEISLKRHTFAENAFIGKCYKTHGSQRTQEVIHIISGRPKVCIRFSDTNTNAKYDTYTYGYSAHDENQYCNDGYICYNPVKLGIVHITNRGRIYEGIV